MKTGTQWSLLKNYSSNLFPRWHIPKCQWLVSSRGKQTVAILGPGDACYRCSAIFITKFSCKPPCFKVPDNTATIWASSWKYVIDNVSDQSKQFQAERYSRPSKDLTAHLKNNDDVYIPNFSRHAASSSYGTKIIIIEWNLLKWTT